MEFNNYQKKYFSTNSFYSYIKEMIGYDCALNCDYFELYDLNEVLISEIKGWDALVTTSHMLPEPIKNSHILYFQIKNTDPINKTMKIYLDYALPVSFRKIVEGLPIRRDNVMSCF